MPSIGIGIGLNNRRGGGWSPLALFRPAGRDGVWVEPIDTFTFAGDDAGDLVDNQGGPDWTTTGSYLYRRDGALKVSVQYVSGNRYGATVADFGTDCTIAWVDEAGGVTIQTGQTVDGAITVPAVDRLGPYLIINSALTSSETVNLTAYLNMRRPSEWLLGVGEWDDNGVWSDVAFWENGVAA